jgi:hypothetical protein
MIGTVENRFGKIFYGVLQVALLVLALYIFNPSGTEFDADFGISALVVLMGLLSFPISIIGVPLSFCLSLAILTVISFLVGQFIDVRNLYPIPNFALLFLTWLGIFICGYLQWFWFLPWFSHWSDKRLGITREPEN